MLLALAVLLFLAGPALAGPCTDSCAETTCTVGCTEDELRDAVRKANDCLGNPAWTGRTITVGVAGCTVSIENDADAAARHPNSSCAADFERHAICLRNEGVTIDGNGADFVYDGAAPCQNCSGACPVPQPALFTVKGERNTIRNLRFRYFPEGIHVRAGSGHTIAGVTADRICEDAITVDATAGTGITIRDSRLAGNQSADKNRLCLSRAGKPGKCGIDDAIQLNGGASTVTGNTIDTIGHPVNAIGGSHVLAGNRTTGTGDANVCQAWLNSGSAVVSMTGNTIESCKFGVRVEGQALVVARDNVIRNPFVSAFNVRGSGRLRGDGNRMRARSNGFSTGSDCQRGLLVAHSGTGRVDFGGGDFAGVSVVDGLPCAAGGSCSAGGNHFCSGGKATQTDIWNVTDCPCLAVSCEGTQGYCRVTTCCPLDAVGSCGGSAGSGASIGARANCFQGPPDVKDSGGNTTAINGATTCRTSDCRF
jgi:hypothetical protein